MEHPISLQELPEKVARLVAPDAPKPPKMMAAAGMAPLPPVELVTALYVLAFDTDVALSDKARHTLANMPETIVVGAVDALEHPGVLDGLARLVLRRPQVVEHLLLNRAVADETVVMLAEKLQDERLLEVIVANEQRLLRCPAIIEKLYFNRNCRMSSVDRAVELAARNGVVLRGIPAFEEVKKAIEGQLLVESGPEPSPEDVAFRSAVDAAASQQVSEQDVEEVLAAEEENRADQVAETAKKQVKTLQAALRDMTVSQKIRMAMLGTASQRSVLIRDSNKLVIMAVLKSPAVNESEVRRYSMLKSLPEEAVRYIATKRDWTKHYAVKRNLVNNPRTPVEMSLRFLNYLRPNDLRALERSKDIPGVIKKAAAELRKKRSG